MITRKRTPKQRRQKRLALEQQKQRGQNTQKQSSQHKQQHTQARGYSPWRNHPAYRLWIREFFQALFDFEFQQSVTVKMLPLLYGIGIIAAAVLAIYSIFTAFLTSVWYGLGFLVLLGPLIFVFCTAALRSTLEFFSVVFRIQHNMHQLLGSLSGMRQELRGMQEDMSLLAKAVDEVAVQASDIANTVNEAKAVIGELEGLTDRIPFFRKPKKTERPKNWAEAPLADQYDLASKERRSKKRPGKPTSSRDTSTPDVSNNGQGSHDSKRSSTLVELNSNRTPPKRGSNANTFNFRPHDNDRTKVAGRNLPKNAGDQPRSQPDAGRKDPSSGDSPSRHSSSIWRNDPAANKPELTD